MNADEIVAALEELPEGKANAGDSSEPAERWFIFALGESWYALDPRLVKEISSGQEVYPLPACPPYVSGLLNAHGQPCTVIDLHLLFTMERLVLPIHLILNRPGDSVAFSCTDIVEISEIPASAMARFGEGEGEAGFFTSSFPLRDRTVLVLSVDAVMEKLRADLG